MRFVSLRSRIRLSIVAGALVPSFLLLGTGGAAIWAELKARDDLQQKARAEQLKEKLSHSLELLVERAEALAEDSDLIRAIQVPIFISKADQRLSDFIERNPPVQSAGLLGRAGETITADPIELEAKALAGPSPFKDCPARSGWKAVSDGRIVITLGVSRRSRPVTDGSADSSEARLCLNVGWGALLRAAFQSPEELASVSGLKAGSDWVIGKPGEMSLGLPAFPGGADRREALTLGIVRDAGQAHAAGRIALLLSLGWMVAIGLIAWLSGALAEAVVRPLAEMAAMVSRYGSGDYSKPPAPGRFLELNLLSTTLGQMGELILKQLEMEKEHNRAELEALKNQLKPHFLFNSLNSIAASVESTPKKTLSMIQSLSDLYRKILESSKTPEHRLSEELSIVSDYLELEKLRYGPRLTFALNVPEALAAYQVPCLLLQTLVENCVKHGISQALDGGRVELSISEQEGTLFTVIENSGEPLAESYRPGTGLENTARRLELAFPGRHGFGIHKTDRGWTRVEFRLPLRRSSSA